MQPTAAVATVQSMLSFVIQAYNEELELPSTIASIRAAAQDRSGRGRIGRGEQYEIVVVDDASTDATARVAQEAGAKVVSINRRQIAAARNAGARHAQGDTLLFVDADTRINEKHLIGVVAALDAGYDGGGADVGVGGSVTRRALVSCGVLCAGLL